MLTASDILSKASMEIGGIITFCKSLDQLLHRSGIPIGSLTEIAGLPGLGKTQLAMQLAVNARLPTALGGVQGQTLYIDAEGSVAPERLHSMAEALLQHCEHTTRKRGRELPPDFREVSQILQDIHVFRVLDEASQTATLYSLPYWIEQLSSTSDTNRSTPVKLVVVDSIAFHYRCSSGTSQDYQDRTRALSQLAAFLNDVARDYNVAVVCLNQMTTKVVEGQSRLVPALGESWAHAVTTRLLLSCDNDNRRSCRLVKSPCMPPGTSYYQVNAMGIRDVEAPRRDSTTTTVTATNSRDDANEDEVSAGRHHARDSPAESIVSASDYKRSRTS
jgi:RAD51-like protein 2